MFLMGNCIVKVKFEQKQLYFLLKDNILNVYLDKILY